MGCGISNSVSPELRKNNIFVSQELHDGCAALHRDAGLRAAFLNYIKSGVWLDHFAHLQEGKVLILSHEERIAREKNSVIYEYKASPQKPVNFSFVLANSTKAKQFAESVMSNFPASSSGHIARKHSGETNRSSLGSTDECYISITNFVNLNEDELMSVMFSVIYPVFLTSSEHQLFLQNGDEHGCAESSEGGSSKKESRQLTKSSRRTQDLFLSCAANFDQFILLQRLEHRNWLEILESAFNNYHMPITVMDTNRPDSPFIYCNRAFETLYSATGPHLKRTTLVGKNLSILNGPETEQFLLDQISDALIQGKATKVAITHYSAGNKSFLNLLALKPSGSYMFAVHCPEGRSTLSEDVQMVDDVLLLLGCVVKAPAPVVKPTRRPSVWLPNLRGNITKALSQHL